MFFICNYIANSTNNNIGGLVVKDNLEKRAMPQWKTRKLHPMVATDNIGDVKPSRIDGTERKAITKYTTQLLICLYNSPSWRRLRLHGGFNGDCVTGYVLSLLDVIYLKIPIDDVRIFARSLMNEILNEQENNYEFSAYGNHGTVKDMITAYIYEYIN